MIWLFIYGFICLHGNNLLDNRIAIQIDNQVYRESSVPCNTEGYFVLQGEDLKPKIHCMGVCIDMYLKWEEIPATGTLSYGRSPKNHDGDIVIIDNPMDNMGVIVSQGAYYVNKEHHLWIVGGFTFLGEVSIDIWIDGNRIDGNHIDGNHIDGNNINRQSYNAIITRNDIWQNNGHFGIDMDIQGGYHIIHVIARGRGCSCITSSNGYTFKRMMGYWWDINPEQNKTIDYNSDILSIVGKNENSYIDDLINT
uniref:Uncharacterized protein n=1 Tax=Megaviridae environmental sample TaxID=1737588 RepID=A0A5J6VKB4_9VIRU|nr:MAG: hypothetical protein [Megaviridae environmental sample]